MNRTRRILVVLAVIGFLDLMVSNVTTVHHYSVQSGVGRWTFFSTTQRKEPTRDPNQLPFILKPINNVSSTNEVRILKTLSTIVPTTTTTNNRTVTTNSTNTTLLIALGGLRGGEETWHTMYKHVLDLNHADLANTEVNQLNIILKNDRTYRSRDIQGPL